jgi:hypothetical protein
LIGRARAPDLADGLHASSPGRVGPTSRRGAPPRTSGPRVAADFEDGDLEIAVADDGEGLRPHQSPGLRAGLQIIAETCDEFVVREREPAGVEL